MFEKGTHIIAVKLIDMLIESLFRRSKSVMRVGFEPTPFRTRYRGHRMT